MRRGASLGSVRSSGEPPRLIINSFHSLQNLLIVSPGGELSTGLGTAWVATFKTEPVPAALSVCFPLFGLLDLAFAGELRCCWREDCAGQPGVTPGLLGNALQMGLWYLLQSHHRLNFMAPEMHSAELSVAVLRPLHTLVNGSFVTVGLLAWAFFFSTLLPH